MSSTKPMSEIWWDNLIALDRYLLMKKYNIKEYSKKAVDRMHRYENEFKK